MNCTEFRTGFIGRIGKADDAPSYGVLNAHRQKCTDCTQWSLDQERLLSIEPPRPPLPDSLSRSGVENALSQRQRFRSFLWVGYVAAAVLLFAGIFRISTGMSPGWKEGPVARLEIGEAVIDGKHVYTQQRRKGSVRLFDGSGVILNPETSLKIDRETSERIVYLEEGGATFDVAPRSEPFVVRTDPAEIRVLGTRFTVEIRSSTKGENMSAIRKTALVTVLAGLVQVSNPLGTITLAAGETGMVEKEKKPEKDRSEKEIEQQLEEKSKEKMLQKKLDESIQVRFREDSFESVLNSLHQQTGVTFRIDPLVDSKQLRESPVSMSVSNQKLSTILNFLTRYLGEDFTYAIRDEAVWIVRNNPMRWNEVAAIKTLKAIVEAEGTFRRLDPDADGADYSLTLDELVDRAGRSMVPNANKEGAINKGYTFRRIQKDEDGILFEEVVYFAFCAFPTAYGESGLHTFIVDAKGVVYRLDNGGKAVEQWPHADPAKANWKMAE